MAFVHLHVHDEYSLLDGFGSPEAYAEKAKSLGMPALAITNHGSVDSLIKFQKACQKQGIKPIHGAELYMVEDISKKEKKEKRSHITVLVKNKAGWNNLLKMITISHSEGYYKRPRISPEIFFKHREGLIVLTACASSFIRTDWGKEFCKRMVELEGADSLFFEIMPHKYEEQEKVNSLAIELAGKLGCKIVATNDCHYIEESDSKVQEVLLAIQRKARWTDKDRWKFEIDGLYLKTAKEMAQAFQEQGQIQKSKYLEAICNTQFVADLCVFEIEQQQVILPDVPGVIGTDRDFLKELCEEEFQKRFKGHPEETVYRDRLTEELSQIERQGFERYFLVIWEMVRWCRENDIMVGPGRGSAGGSLVCYLLNITRVDPVKYKLVFARFISPARIDLPDVDMDFEDIKRDKIRAHLEDIYGKNNVAGVSTFMNLKGKGALRDVSRVFNVPLSDVNKGAGSIVTRSGGDARAEYSIMDSFETFEDGIYFKNKYPEVAQIASRIEGSVKGKGMHACATVISADDLHTGERASICYGKDGVAMVNWDKYDIEHVGLMKMDILGLNALTVLNEARKEVERVYGVNIDFDSIPMDDKKCFEEFSKGNNTGCFQVGSLGLKRYCQQLGVDDFDMLVHATSLYRPGTLRSGMATEFIARKKGEVVWESQHPAIAELTKDTYGIILYQEQVMKFTNELAGLGWRTADVIRKVISKSQGADEFQKFQDMFADGCVNKGTLDRETAKRLWQELSNFGSYGFNLSHAVEYSVITYWQMWFKVNYPEQFLCASLTHGTDEKKEELVEEAVRLGLEVRPPKIGKSHSHNWVSSDRILYTPFIEIKGFGDATAKKAAGELKKAKRQTAKISFFDITENKTAKAELGLGDKLSELLSKIYCFDDSPVTEEQAEEIKQHFQFSFSRDKARKVKPIIKRIGLKFRDIKSINFNQEDRQFNFYFGYMTETKFGYKQAITKGDGKRKADTVDNLGSVYGNFKDETDFCMMIFGGDIYSRKKNLVEHSVDKFLISKANVPRKTGSIHCADAWFEEELFSGELKGMGLKLAEKRCFRNKEILDCSACDLCKTGAPTLPRVGRYNALLVLEQPIDSAQESLIEKILSKNGLSLRDFGVTSIVKCKQTAKIKYGSKEVKKCKKWLEEEFEKIDPFLVLTFGSLGLKEFAGEETGIMERSGQFEWNTEYNCWVGYSVSPLSALFHKENLPLLEEALKNFCDRFKDIGGICEK